jgi:two-component system, NtrC family, sensor kinase
LRLQAKLVVAMSLAALLPVVVVTLVATQTIFSSLDRGIRSDADRQLLVANNLLLRAAERLGDQSVQLANTSDLAPAMKKSSVELEAWLARTTVDTVSAVVQIISRDGNQLARHVIGGNPGRFAGSVWNDRKTEHGWSTEVSFVEVDHVTVIRAWAPIVDSSFALQGSLVMSVPLDGDFADSLKGSLGVDVLVGAMNQPLQITLRDGDGARVAPIVLDPATWSKLASGKRATFDVSDSSGQFVLALTALADRDRYVGVLGVAVDRARLAHTKSVSIRTLIVGVIFALAAAIALALWWARRLNAPLAKLHRGAIAVSRGDLNYRTSLPPGDEIGDLATAFNHMTQTLQENQIRLAARMREIVALHDAGRAVSAVLDPEQVPRKVVDALARTFDVQVVGLWIMNDAQKLILKAARGRRPDVSLALLAQDAIVQAAALDEQAQLTANGDVVRLAAGQCKNHSGPVVGMPLDRKGRVVGAVVVAREASGRAFAEADLSLLATFADQASAAIDNATLYQQVRGASEQLERKVELRTHELTVMNAELGRTLDDLRATQAQLILSERLAGLGMLVAGVAHEINSPSAAIRGSVQNLATAIERVSERLLNVGRLPLHEVQRQAIAEYLRYVVPGLARRRMLSGVAARVVLKEIRADLRGRFNAVDPSVDGEDIVASISRSLSDAGVQAAEVAQFWTLIEANPLQLGPPLAELMVELIYLHRTGSTVSDAIGRIARIVGALKSYSHLDQHAQRAPADLHAGIESTLALFDFQLRDISVERDFAALPPIPIFVDELNQVWTNLLQNATQAILSMSKRDALNGHIAIRTLLQQPHVVIVIADNGPGIPRDVVDKIFDPFFTTKPKGEGTGLGLGIVRQIVEKHQGTIVCRTKPGATEFEIRLPLELS